MRQHFLKMNNLEVLCTDCGIRTSRMGYLAGNYPAGMFDSDCPGPGVVAVSSAAASSDPTDFYGHYWQPRYHGLVASNTMSCKYCGAISSSVNSQRPCSNKAPLFHDWDLSQAICNHCGTRTMDLAGPHEMNGPCRAKGPGDGPMPIRRGFSFADHQDALGIPRAKTQEEIMERRGHSSDWVEPYSGLPAECSCPSLLNGHHNGCPLKSS